MRLVPFVLALAVAAPVPKPTGFAEVDFSPLEGTGERDERGYRERVVRLTIDVVTREMRMPTNYPADLAVGADFLASKFPPELDVRPVPGQPKLVVCGKDVRSVECKQAKVRRTKDKPPLTKRVTTPAVIDFEPLIGAGFNTVILYNRSGEAFFLHVEFATLKDAIKGVAELAEDGDSFAKEAVAGEPKLVIRGLKDGTAVEISCVAAGLPEKNQPKVSRLKEDKKDKK